MEEERVALSALISQAREVLESAEFTENMKALGAAYPRSFANPDWPDVSTERLLAILSLQEPGTHRIRIPVALIGSEAFNDGSGNFNYTARTGSTHWNGAEPTGSMALGRVTMYRWKQTNVVDRSCAISTMAHEMTHAISREAGRYRYAIEDTGIAFRTDKTTPLGSYLIGSVAQCTWLQRLTRIGSRDVAKCVAVFGTQNFNSNRCPQFADGQAVEERDGLAPPADPL
jgi:hypothetical protein